MAAIFVCSPLLQQKLGSAITQPDKQEASIWHQQQKKSTAEFALTMIKVCSHERKGLPSRA